MKLAGYPFHLGVTALSEVQSREEGLKLVWLPVMYVGVNFQKYNPEKKD